MVTQYERILVESSTGSPKAVLKLGISFQNTKIAGDEIHSYSGCHFRDTYSNSPLPQKTPCQNLITNAFECNGIYHGWRLDKTI